MIRHKALHASLLAGLLAGLVALPAVAQQQAVSGLGQSSPQATNVSAAPGWRVYVFVQDGVKYIQVNDLVGTVRVVVATANGYFLALPMGVDATRVSTPNKPLTAAVRSTAPGITVYQDNAVQLTARYQSDGTTVWTATAKKMPTAMATTPVAAPSATPSPTPSTDPKGCPQCGAQGQ